MTEITQKILFSNTQPESEQKTEQNEPLALLKQHFAHCFDKNGAFLPEKMAQTLQASGINTQKEYYNLNWLGKSYAKILKDQPPETLLSEDIKHNQQPENQNSQNVLIQGDNLEVLKHLKHAYKSQIKMIYIDPPYNTGSDGFVYQDDRKFTPQQLVELGMDLEEAERVLAFTAKKSNSHAAWLTFMYPRLYVARDLLKDDGVIFISIDDNEQAQLKLLCDEVFGEENFVADFIWNNKYTVSNDTDISYQHEHILCYSKKRIIFSLNLLERTEKQNKDYKNRDKDPKGAWKATPIHARSGTENSIYTIEFPNGITWTTPKGRYPRYSKTKLQELYDEGALYFNKKGGVDKKTYLCEVRNGVTCGTLWGYDEVGHSHGNNEEITDLLGKGIFNDPKGVALLKKIIQLSTSKDSNHFILDFFAGSGTTANAVMDINKDDKGNRKFILVQLAEKPKSEAFKAGYQTIFEITKARIEKAAAKIRTENPDYSGDLGFKIFNTQTNFQPDLPTDFDKTADLFSQVDFTHEQLHTLLTTWRVYDGSQLPEKVQVIDLAGYTAYFCRNHLYLLASGFTSNSVKALIERLDNDPDFIPERIVLFGANMDSAMQKELVQAVQTYANKKELNNLSVLARY
ncbi:type iii restriction-modification system methyltransferase [Moraxella macacae 0408225]|uniref:site-specific DNA-methyltransferase (adenine-specific) n=1 Tax=Moraxella macacae 0408225 TaxID=1230338 RepID=L2F9P8_9GAMM|nr:site-specific DNA-methyltransferase [Moraxella macacae]ELA09610.1 type iii restriction-modification system methyltransferase [Moraxella macacae 0408225]